MLTSPDWAKRVSGRLAELTGALYHFLRRSRERSATSASSGGDEREPREPPSLHVALQECGERPQDVVIGRILGRHDVEMREPFAHVDLEAAIRATEGREGRIRRVGVDDPW